ncbi:MAG: hypothetical protein P8179_18530 [Candidatus Thiodiazotropha sp.]
MTSLIFSSLAGLGGIIAASQTKGSPGLKGFNQLKIFKLRYIKAVSWNALVKSGMPIGIPISIVGSILKFFSNSTLNNPL